FLHPEHERRAAEIVREECPDVWVSTSSVVLPQFREFERSMATVLNAYVTPHVSRYLGTVAERLGGAGLTDSRLFIMNSNGGVSRARVSSTGRLTVGPESAGAVPGPVCYGKGGTEPTVTDAHLVLGRIPPSLVGGEVVLDRESAERAIQDKIAVPLGLGLEEA